MNADNPTKSVEALKDLAFKIAQAMRAPWRPDEPRTRNMTPGVYENPDWSYFQGDGDERFSIHYASDTRAGLKLFVSGTYPATARGEYIRPRTRQPSTAPSVVAHKQLQRTSSGVSCLDTARLLHRY